MVISQFNSKISKDVVIESPKDEILSGIIVNIERGLLKDFINPEVYSKFDNLDQDTLRIFFEIKYNDKIIKGNDRLAFYDEPMTNSKLAKFLTKYNTLETGVKIKVIFDSNGFGKIKVD